MANHKSAIKRHRQSIKRTLRNLAVKTRIKNVIKSVHTAITSNEHEKAEQLLITATSTIDKAAKKGVIHWKKAARKVSHLTKSLNIAKQASM